MIPDALRVLYDRAGGPPLPLPAPLLAWLGGPLHLPEPPGRPALIANFVQALDGVVAFPGPGRNPLFGEPHDRMLMSLLRAWSDAVIVGRNTLAADPRVATWHWKTTAPAGSRPWFEEMAGLLGRPRPHLEVFVTAGGRGLDFDRAVFRDEDVAAVVATTSRGEPHARAALAAAPGARAEIWSLDGARGGLDLEALLRALQERGRTHVLSEGGPHLHGSLEAARLLDELWLSHRGLVGGSTAAEPRPTFSGRAHATDTLPRLELRAVRLAEGTGTLFTRWRYLGAAG